MLPGCPSTALQSERKKHQCHQVKFDIQTLSSVISLVYRFLVSKETVVLRRWERSKQKFGFIKRVDKG